MSLVLCVSRRISSLSSLGLRVGLLSTRIEGEKSASVAVGVKGASACGPQPGGTTERGCANAGTSGDGCGPSPGTTHDPSRMRVMLAPTDRRAVLTSSVREAPQIGNVVAFVAAVAAFSSATTVLAASPAGPKHHGRVLPLLLLLHAATESPTAASTLAGGTFDESSYALSLPSVLHKRTRRRSVSVEGGECGTRAVRRSLATCRFPTMYSAPLADAKPSIAMPPERDGVGLLDDADTAAAISFETMNTSPSMRIGPVASSAKGVSRPPPLVSNVHPFSVRFPAKGPPEVKGAKEEEWPAIEMKGVIVPPAGGGAQGGASHRLKATPLMTMALPSAVCVGRRSW